MFSGFKSNGILTGFKILNMFGRVSEKTESFVDDDQNIDFQSLTNNQDVWNLLQYLSYMEPDISIPYNIVCSIVRELNSNSDPKFAILQLNGILSCEFSLMNWDVNSVLLSQKFTRQIQEYISTYQNNTESDKIMDPELVVDNLVRIIGSTSIDMGDEDKNLTYYYHIKKILEENYITNGNCNPSLEIKNLYLSLGGYYQQLNPNSEEAKSCFTEADAIEKILAGEIE
ncbi:MAG: hypothetical protein DGJ47_001101 [Rickettsiaceae bacterium]